MDYTNVVTLASGHIDAEAYFDSLHLNNEKGTKKFANNVKFALGLETKMQSANRDYYSRQENQQQALNLDRHFLQWLQ